jgi:hypothetical protein
MERINRIYRHGIGATPQSGTKKSIIAKWLASPGLTYGSNLR